MEDFLDLCEDFGGCIGCVRIVVEGGDLEEGEALDWNNFISDLSFFGGLLLSSNG